MSYHDFALHACPVHHIWRNGSSEECLPTSRRPLSNPCVMRRASAVETGSSSSDLIGALRSSTLSASCSSYLSTSSNASQSGKPPVASFFWPRSDLPGSRRAAGQCGRCEPAWSAARPGRAKEAKPRPAHRRAPPWPPCCFEETQRSGPKVLSCGSCGNGSIGLGQPANPHIK